MRCVNTAAAVHGHDATIGMILDTIIDHKKTEVAHSKRTAPLAHVRAMASSAPCAADFFGALRADCGARNRIIAEVKKASPSKGVLCHAFDHVAIARTYERNGAAAISVLTDKKFFMGLGSHLHDIKQAVSVPVFRKDFIIDAYQVYESRALGADALLLIAAVLDVAQLGDLLRLTEEQGMQALIEVHSARELDAALQAGARCIGINNRDLTTFATDIRVTLDLIIAVPAGIPVVSESGIQASNDIQRLKQAGVSAFLIGEALVCANDPGAALAAFVDA